MSLLDEYTGSAAMSAEDVKESGAALAYWLRQKTLDPEGVREQFENLKRRYECLSAHMSSLEYYLQRTGGAE